MKITAVANPVYSNAEHSSIDCLVTFDELGQHPYTSVAQDNTDYGIQLWADLNDGKYGAIGDYVPPAP